MDWLIREKQLIGEKAVNILQNSSVTVFGIGGVGSFTAEALARGGIGNIVLVDDKCIDETNINRQIHADKDTIGIKKVIIMKERILKINPKANVTVHKIFYTGKEEEVFTPRPDYVIDAVDTISAKINIIKYCSYSNIPLVSCMGTGNKLNGEAFKISDISKTSICPVARVMRKELRKHNIRNLKVVWSDEKPVVNVRPPASISFVPSIAGLLLAGEAIKDLIKDYQ